jgi:hypothetical protein
MIVKHKIKDEKHRTSDEKIQRNKDILTSL